MARIAFIGLGTMGQPMAASLIRAGHELTVYDVSPACSASAAEMGATSCTSPLHACEGVDFVVTMLPDGPIVRQLLGGATGLFAQLEGQATPLFIDCSTIAPEDARMLAQEAADHGMDYIDAPVSGGVQAAADATLAIMVGANVRQYDRAQPVLSAMARSLVHAGPAGSGQAAKICNNMLAAVIMAGTAEALALGEGLGLDAHVLSAIIGASSGGSFLLERWNPYPGVVAQAPSSRDYRNGFQLRLMLKDIGLALDSARALKRPVPMGSLSHSLYAMQLHSSPDAAGLDFSKIVDVFRAGLSAARTSG